MSVTSPEGRFEEYERWCAAGAAFPGVCALGKGLRSVLGEERSAFRRELKRRVKPEVLSDAAVEATARWRSAMRIMSIGSKFDEDELLLILTSRQQIELVMDVLTVFGIAVADIELAKVDTELREIAASKENRRAFLRALSAIQRNGDTEVVDLWSR